MVCDICWAGYIFVCIPAWFIFSPFIPRRASVLKNYTCVSLLRELNYIIPLSLLQNVQYNHPNRFHNAIAQYVHAYWKYWGLLIREIRGILFLFLHSNSQKILANFVFLNHSLSFYMVPSGELQSRNETYGGS